MTFSRTYISQMDSYLVEWLRSRMRTEGNVCTMRTQAVPLVGRFLFLGKVFTLGPLWISHHWALLLIQIKVLRVSHSMPGNVSRAGRVPEDRGGGPSHLYCQHGSPSPTSVLDKISPIPHSPRTLHLTGHTTFFYCPGFYCVRLAQLEYLMFPTGSCFEC